MLAKIDSYGLSGLVGYKIDVEVDINQGLPSYDVVGLPDASVKESKERVHSAIKNSLMQFPKHKIIVNLAPANTKKEGPIFDLAIAMSILAASEQIKKYCKLDEQSEQILKAAFDKFKMSARGYTRILKVARTIADLEDQENINSNHILEAISYRTIDKLQI